MYRPFSIKLKTENGEFPKFIIIHDVCYVNIFSAVETIVCAAKCIASVATIIKYFNVLFISCVPVSLHAYIFEEPAFSIVYIMFWLFDHSQMSVFIVTLTIHRCLYLL